MASASAVRRAITGLVLAVAALSPNLVHAKGPWNQGRSDDRTATVAVAELPPQGREVFSRIRQGGPFSYDKDGTVFGNRERQLPGHPRGYYREYTVKTPGSRDRGARRIVCGGQPRAPEACYYTSDHYASFRRIVE